MHKMPGSCPICSSEMSITKIHCESCDTNIEGKFKASGFSQLNTDQLIFVETFIRCEGKLTRMEAELGLSYPTIRNRLHDIIRQMGYEPGESYAFRVSDKDRKTILEDLDKGDISYEEAVQLLQGEQ